jgi:hypothetical protein
MRAGLVVSVVTAGLLTVALPAVAKGPVSASIEGPGLADPLVVQWSVASEELAGLLTHSRLSDVLGAATGAVPPGVTAVAPSRSPPTRRLGSQYVVIYDMGTPGEVVREGLYPYAAGGPVVHVPAGQWFGTWPLRGGWLRADVALLDVLTDVGLPAVDPVRPVATAPTPSASSPISGQPKGGCSLVCSCSACRPLWDG